LSEIRLFYRCGCVEFNWHTCFRIHYKFGPLIITLYLMVAKDVTKVMIIFAIFLLQFGLGKFGGLYSLMPSKNCSDPSFTP